MALDILRRTGGWMVELAVPIKVGNKDVTEIEIKAPTISILTRWQSGAIASSMALLSELCGIPEQSLVNIAYPDADRVLMALFNVVPQPIKSDFTAGARPLASEGDQIPEPDPGTRPVAVDDPRFPHHDGPVQPLAPAPPPSPEPPPPPPSTASTWMALVR